MTVKELKALLEGYPDEYRVLLSKDSEGNAYHDVDPLSEEGKDVVIIYPHDEEVDPDEKAEPEEEVHREGGGEEETPAGGDAGSQ